MAGLEELAMRVLSQRGAPPTPANLQAIKNALEANPQLLDNVQGLLRQQEQTQTREGDVSTPAPVVFRDQFDEALARAVNNGQPIATPEAAPVAAGSTTQPAPSIVPVDQLALAETSTAAPNPPPVAPEGLASLPGQVGPLPGDFDAAAQDAATREIGIPPLIPVPLAAPRQPGTDVVPSSSATPRPGAQGALPGPQGALPAPLQALSGPPRAVAAPLKQLTGPGTPQAPVEDVRIAFPESKVVSSEDILNAHAEAIGRGDIPAGRNTTDWRQAAADLENAGLLALEEDNPVRATRTRKPKVEEDIGRTIDAQDGPIRSTTNRGQEAIEFDLGQQRIQMTADGSVVATTPSGELAQVREPGLLQTIKEFLVKNKHIFARLL